jgi:glycosyltransferase involved in cell wall biosynthesis
MANQTRQLADLLSGEGVSVELVQVNAPYRPRWVGRLRGVRALFRLAPYLGRLWAAAGRAQVFHVMANSGWSWHLFAAPAVWVAKLRGVRVVLNYRGGGAERFFRRSFRVAGPTMRLADAVIVPSGFLRQVFHRHGIPTRIVPNIIDLHRFAPRDAAGAGAHPPHIVVARNLEPIYDVGTALRAFCELRRHLPDARLTVAGEGRERRKLEALARQLCIGEATVFTGRLDNERMGELYRTADATLNPSLVDNMPISILESLACGVPVVSTRVGGVPYLVEDGRTALLVPPGDHLAMADALRRVLTDRALAQGLAAAGLETAQSYAWPRVRAALLCVYAGVSGTDDAAAAALEGK